MPAIRTLLVDDEYLALNLLEEYVRAIPGLELAGRVKSAIAALEVLEKEPVDLLFLDIQMPGLSGVNFLKTLKNPPVAVFTTAYSEYAVQAFDLNAVDYLVKPFSFERFVQAVNKAREHIRRDPFPLEGFLSAKVDGRLVKIFYEDILYVEGLKEYVRFVCQSGRYVTLESLKNLEELLPANRFLRVHKSFIVALNQVRSIEGNMLEIQTHRIPISRERREEIIRVVFGK